mmetsp:Transcript_16500/g.26941  ORF Transcript_16500/g.26941 Transcript_16500/m.26941 type:complete len:367 (+) Transcript_16500:1680-2780(+)
MAFRATPEERRRPRSPARAPAASLPPPPAARSPPPVAASAVSWRTALPLPLRQFLSKTSWLRMRATRLDSFWLAFCPLEAPRSTMFRNLSTTTRAPAAAAAAPASAAQVQSTTGRSTSSHRPNFMVPGDPRMVRQMGGARPSRLITASRCRALAYRAAFSISAFSCASRAYCRPRTSTPAECPCPRRPAASTLGAPSRASPHIARASCVTCQVYPPCGSAPDCVTSTASRTRNTSNRTFLAANASSASFKFRRSAAASGSPAASPRLSSSCREPRGSSHAGSASRSAVRSRASGPGSFSFFPSMLRRLFPSPPPPSAAGPPPPPPSFPFFFFSLLASTRSTSCSWCQGRLPRTTRKPTPLESEGPS